MAKKQKHTTLPERYTPGMLRDFDRRTEIYQRLNAAYQAVVSDAGGVDNLTHAKLALVERFVFLEATLQAWEKEIVSNPTEAGELLSRWIQGINSLQGLAKTIGLERQMKQVVNLREYVGTQ